MHVSVRVRELLSAARGCDSNVRNVVAVVIAAVVVVLGGGGGGVVIGVVVHRGCTVVFIEGAP
jgi:hypothetical protein